MRCSIRGKHATDSRSRQLQRYVVMHAFDWTVKNNADNQILRIKVMKRLLILLQSGCAKGRSNLFQIIFLPLKTDL